MSFQVKFGSESNLHENNSSSRGQRAGRRDSDTRYHGEAQDQHGQRGRSRGRGGGRYRGRRPRRGGGNRPADGADTNDRDEDSNGSEDSDGASSVVSEGRGEYRGRGGGGRGRGQGRRGRGGNSRPSRGGRSDFAEYGDPRSPSEQNASAAPAQQEIHIHYHALPQSVGGPAPLMPHPMSSPQPLASQPGYAYTQPSGPPLPSNLGHFQQPYSSGPLQGPHQAYPPQHQQNLGQPFFGPANPPPVTLSGQRPSLLNNPPPLFSQGNQFKGDQPINRPSQQRSAPERQFDARHSNSAGPARGSSQNLNQKFPAQRSERDVRPKQREDFGRRGQRPETDQPDRKPDGKKEQEPAGPSKDKVDVPDLSPDEWIKIFNVLLKQFKGRTKLGTLLSQKGDLFKGLNHAQAAAWLKHSNRFLTFEKDGKIKFVSVFFREARTCFKYKKHYTDKCENDSCPFYHICRDFISGHCPRQSQCHFNHSFHAKHNAKVSAEAGLLAFTDEDITTIVLRSTPVVCDKFSKGKCSGDCPDLHVCAEYIMNKCSDENCKLGHQIKGTEQNEWVLETFHMQRIQEHTLCKMAIIMKAEVLQITEMKKPPASSSGSKGEEPQDPRQYQDKAYKMRKHWSRENMAGASEMSVPPDAEQESSSSADKRQQRRKPKERRSRNNGDMESTSPPDQTGADVAEDYRQSSPPKMHFVPGEKARLRAEERIHSPVVLTGVKQAASLEGREGRGALPASNYTHLCEHHTWTDTCPKGYLCPRYHHRHKPPFVWQLNVFEDWLDLTEMDSIDMEQRFCGWHSQVVFEVVLENVGGMQLSLDFTKMTATVIASSDSTGMVPNKTLRVRRWSTPSYVESEAGAPFTFLTQWIWYYRDDRGHNQPFIPGSLQYTLEEKYLSRQQKYYFEVGEERFLLYLQEMRLVNLSRETEAPVLRRPVFFDQYAGSATPVLSNMLLTGPPDVHWPSLPSQWGQVDCYQDFEMVELDAASSEFLDVERSFHSTLSRDRVNVMRVFRVQNPSLWDKYCSTKRAMMPRGGLPQDVDERKLFHGTPSILAARGICANNIDFRRAGENVGAMFGRGSYFSAHAVYSHSYTQGPDRYMFLAKVLVGKFTRGDPSYTSPPVREGLKLYDSCVDDEVNPTIFVIFDLAQSYPEYLIQYNDAEMGPGNVVRSVQASSTVSGSDLAGPGARPVPRPRASVASAAPKSAFVTEEEAARKTVTPQQARNQPERGTVVDPDTMNRAGGDPPVLRYQNPYSLTSGPADSGRQESFDLSALEESVKRELASWRESSARAKRKSNPDKCVLS